jgi:Tol biopolymer transport system component
MMKKLVLGLSAACVAVVAIAAIPAILSDAGGAQSAGPVPTALVLGTRPGENASTDTAPSVTGRPGVPEVDYTIDLNTGVMTPLPKAIIRSVAKPDERFVFLTSPRYAVSGDGSQLAYIGIGDEGSLQIFTAGIDGTEVRQVTHDPAGATYPAWSPDGTKIVYEGSGGLFVLDVGTGESTPVTDGTPIQPSNQWFSPQSEPQFTPDGSSLVYTGRSKGRLVVRTVPVAGGKSTLLIGPGEGVEDAGNGSLSPDGSLVTYLGSGFPLAGDGITANGHCGPCRFVANADGTERRVIPGCYGSNPAGTWSPDGTRIVCNGIGVIVVDIATGDLSPVAEGNGAIWLNGHTLLVEVL